MAVDSANKSVNPTNNSSKKQQENSSNILQDWGLGFTLSLTAGTFGFDASVGGAEFSLIAQISEVVVVGANENGTILAGKDNSGTETITWGGSGGEVLTAGYTKEYTRKEGQKNYSVTKDEVSYGYNNLTVLGNTGNNNNQKVGAEIDILKIKAGFGMGLEIGAKMDLSKFATKLANSLSGGGGNTRIRNSNPSFTPSDATKVSTTRYLSPIKKP